MTKYLLLLLLLTFFVSEPLLARGRGGRSFSRSSYNRSYSSRSYYKPSRITRKPVPVAPKTTPIAPKTTPIAPKTTPIAPKTTPVANKRIPEAKSSVVNDTKPVQHVTNITNESNNGSFFDKALLYLTAWNVFSGGNSSSSNSDEKPTDDIKGQAK